jgi:hypothetical protein
MSTAADGHSGTDLVEFLNELLEAERAGARVTLESVRSAAGEAYAALMREVHRDEARWCGMLFRNIKALGATPSPRVGGFYEKAMAIADPGERLAFLNRGQAWVARKLREKLPEISDERLHAELAEMLRSHEDNIARAAEVASRLA